MVSASPWHLLINTRPYIHDRYTHRTPPNRTQANAYNNSARPSGMWMNRIYFIGDLAMYVVIYFYVVDACMHACRYALPTVRSAARRGGGVGWGQVSCDEAGCDRVVRGGIAEYLGKVFLFEVIPIFPARFSCKHRIASCGQLAQRWICKVNPLNSSQSYGRESLSDFLLPQCKYPMELTQFHTPGTEPVLTCVGGHVSDISILWEN